VVPAAVAASAAPVRLYTEWLGIKKELADAGIDNPAVAPILLPDYSTDEVAERRWPQARTVAEPIN
jgi:hypothetical protein